MTAIIGSSIGQSAVTFNAYSDHGLAEYRRMKTLGFTSIRFDAYYVSSGPISNDATIRAAIVAGLNPLIILDAYTTTIGNSAFVTFATNVVSIYSALGAHYYEMLNEPNAPINWDPVDGTTNPANYTALVKLLYPAIKAADPDATVILGGTAPYGSNGNYGGTYDNGTGDYTGTVNPLTWLAGCYSAGIHGYFDAVGQHPYTYPLMPNNLQTYNAVYQLYGTTPNVRSIMSANNDSAKPIWVTEFGCPSASGSGIDANPDPINSPAGTYAHQAANISQGLVTMLATSGIGAVYISEWYDNASDGYFGLCDAVGDPKPALTAVLGIINPSAIIRQLGISPYRGRIVDTY